MPIDLNVFIEECRYFFQITKEYRRTDEESDNEDYTTEWSDEDLQTIDKLIVDFQDSLRALEKPKSTITGKVKIGPNGFFDRIHKLAIRLVVHKWNKEERKKVLLIHYTDDKMIQILDKDAWYAATGNLYSRICILLKENIV